MRRRFVQVDVFGDEPFFGNPLAVVVDSEGLSTAEMQTFAAWTNLSETTFLLPPTNPEGDYRVRIFTPTEELPFAGHPTLGSAHAWLANGGKARDTATIVQECGVGHVRVRHDDLGLAFAAPPLLRGGPADEPVIADAADSLGISRSSIVDAAWIDNGPGWLGLLLGSAEEVRGVRQRRPGPTVGLVGPCPEGSRFAFEVRAFYSSGGVTLEDPVTGSLNASVAQWMIETGRANAPYLVSQGSQVGRKGVVRITTDTAGGVWIGGDVVTCVEGFVEL
jgi:predicted PhzF superfamily epimerase YddE/YHI9